MRRSSMTFVAVLLALALAGPVFAGQVFAGQTKEEAKAGLQTEPPLFFLSTETLTGDPVVDCCDRQSDFYSSLCTCGVESISCWSNGRGGCTTRCTCSSCV
jgi:hypothetical protein